VTTLYFDDSKTIVKLISTIIFYTYYSVTIRIKLSGRI
jgi:hypothetical protein